jgi:hypothetical protein
MIDNLMKQEQMEFTSPNRIGIKRGKKCMRMTMISMKWMVRLQIGSEKSYENIA